MKTTKQALIIVGIGVCICYVVYSYLADWYCWECTSQDYFVKGMALVLKDDNDSKQRGLRFLESAAQKWNVDSQILLGELYLGSFPEVYHIQNEGEIKALRNSVPVDEKKGKAYFDKLAVSLYSAQGNYSEMKYNLGILFKMGVLTSPNNEEQARKWFSMAAEQGNAHAMYELGMYYNNTKGDYERARQWFTNAFNSGEESRSAIMIGDYYFYGKGLTKDYNQSVEWYNKALNALSRSASMYPKKVREEVTQNARHRLKIAQKKAQDTLKVTYAVVGGVRTYSIYTPDLTGALIGAVNNEDGKIQADIKEGVLSEDSGPTIQAVDSMNEGLFWVLNAYARYTYGADKSFSFVLSKKPDCLK